MRSRRTAIHLMFWTALATPVTTGCAQEEPDVHQTPPPPAPADPEVVAVDWLGRGAIYAAQVRERRGQHVHVEYADGDREWVETSRIQPWPDLTDSPVMVWTRRGPLGATVIETSGFLVHVRFDDGAHTWFGRDQLYALQGAPPTGGASAATFPLRHGVDPSQIRVGANVLAYWLNAGELMPQRPWTAEITSVDGDRIGVRYLYDDTVGTLTQKQILHVFEEVGAPPVGERVWLAGSTPIGTVVGRQGDSFRVETPNGEETVAPDRIIALAPPVPRDRLVAGTHVTALWGGSALYHGTIQSVAGDEITVAWHDGSEPSATTVGDVLDTWQPAD